jgi:lipopolysaccharide transport protein LptA
MEMLKLILILAAIINPSSLVFAEDNLHINSEKLVLDRKKNTAVFTGNVLICFQGMKLSTHKAIFTFEDGPAKKIKIITFPEKLQAVRQLKKEASVIIANEGEYTNSNKELVLKGHVIIEDKKEVIITEEMLYYGELNNIVLNSE